MFESDSLSSIFNTWHDFQMHNRITNNAQTPLDIILATLLKQLCSEQPFVQSSASMRIAG